MTKRDRSSLAGTPAKPTGMVPTGKISAGLHRDTDLKDDEFDQEEQRSQPRKRQRTDARSIETPVGEQQVQAKPHRISRLAEVLIRVFTKITSYLEPIDIIFLARINKRFRNLLMRRSSVDIWRGSMDNVLGLPACPPDMNEPSYLALVFLKSCTSCGKDGETQINGVLRVRLCGSCRETCLIDWDTVPSGIKSLIPFSSKIAPTPRRSHSYSLHVDVLALMAQLENIKELNSDEAYQAWVAEKRGLVQKRWQHAQKLKEFLEATGLVRETKLGDAKAVRQEVIEHRLAKAGWSSADMDFDYPGCTNKRAWLNLVSQPKALTDQEWPILQTRLVNLLEQNRKQRLATQKEDRRARLSELFLAIKERGCFAIEISVPTTRTSNSDLASSIIATCAPPFPDFCHTLNCPVVLDLYETDRSVTEMEAKFEEHRKEIEGYVTGWQNRVLAHLAKLLPKIPKTSNTTLLSTPITYDKPSRLISLPGDIKRLLRADSFFKRNLGQSYTYSSILKYHHLDGTHTSTWTTSPLPPPNLDQITWDSEANKVAQELLTSMGKPDASYLEMTDEAIYMCGRCHDNEAKTWERMVEHYMLERKAYPRIREDIRRFRLNVTYKNVHAPNPSSKQPFVQNALLHPPDEDPERFECKFCPDLLAYHVVAPQLTIEKHLQDVHGISDPEIFEDYDYHITESDGSHDLDDEFSDEGGCDYARHHLASQARYDRRRRNRHYGRIRCAYE